MFRPKFRAFMWMTAMTAAASFTVLTAYDESDDQDGDDCVCENSGPAFHLHFSNENIDIYDETPDTLYKDADWASKIEEYSDYLSH